MLGRGDRVEADAEGGSDSSEDELSRLEMKDGGGVHERVSSPLSDDKVYRNAVKDRMEAERARQKSDALSKLERAYKDKTFLITQANGLKTDLVRARAENDTMKKEIKYKATIMAKGSEMTSHAMQDLLGKYFTSRTRECMLRLRAGYERAVNYGFRKWLAVTVQERTKQNTSNEVKERLHSIMSKAQREAEAAKLAEKAAWRVVSQIKKHSDKGPGAGARGPLSLLLDQLKRTAGTDMPVDRIKTRSASMGVTDYEIKRSILLSQANDVLSTTDGGKGREASSCNSSSSSMCSHSSSSNTKDGGTGTGTGAGADGTQSKYKTQGMSDSKPIDASTFFANKTASKTTSSAAENPPASPLKSLIENAISELSQLDDDDGPVGADYESALAAIMGSVQATPSSVVSLASLQQSSSASSTSSSRRPSYMQHTRQHFHGGNVLSEKAKREKERAAASSPPSSRARTMSELNTSLFTLAGSPRSHRHGHGGGRGSPTKPKNMTKAQYKLIYGVMSTYNEPHHPTMPSGIHTSPGKKWF